MSAGFLKGMLFAGMQPAVVKYGGNKSVANGDCKGFPMLLASVGFRWANFVEQRATGDSKLSLKLAKL